MPCCPFLLWLPRRFPCLKNFADTPAHCSLAQAGFGSLSSIHHIFSIMDTSSESMEAPVFCSLGSATGSATTGSRGGPRAGRCTPPSRARGWTPSWSLSQGEWGHMPGPQSCAVPGSASRQSLSTSSSVPRKSDSCQNDSLW
jgi:hypothetical protein